MTGRKDILQNRAELHLAEKTARFDVRKHLFQVPNSSRKRLHFAQALVYLLKPFAHHFKRLSKTRFQRFFKAFVDRFAHLLKLCGVVLLHRGQPVFDRRADARKLLFILRHELGEPAVNAARQLRNRFLQAVLPD